IEELAQVMTEAALAADLSQQERQDWAGRIEALEEEGDDWGLGEYLEVARFAALQGWDDPALQRVLRGEGIEEGIWEGEPPDCADELADARLAVLERQGRLQEYLHLAEAEGRTERYLTMLVRLGRVEEAVVAALEQLGDAGQALSVAKALEERGAVEDALR